jgi:hypothetical protein
MAAGLQVTISIPSLLHLLTKPNRNLQCTKHVIFLSPFFTSSQHDWEAGMTQAIGRARRFGQERTVHVYHLVKHTYDANIFQKRHEKNLVDRNGVPTLVPADGILQIAYSYPDSVVA